MHMVFGICIRAGGACTGRGIAGRRLKRGILKFALLKLLAEMPRHGYELIRAFREKGGARGAGSVYPILSALEAAGLIVGRDEGDRRTYEVTDKGRRLLEEHAKDLGRLLRGRRGRASEAEARPACATPRAADAVDLTAWRRLETRNDRTCL